MLDMGSTGLRLWVVVPMCCGQWKPMCIVIVSVGGGNPCIWAVVT